ncbi:pteridine-dependent deoxygenase [soil metagenome]
MTEARLSNLRSTQLPFFNGAEEARRPNGNALASISFGLHSLESDSGHDGNQAAPQARVPMAALDPTARSGSALEIWLADGSFTVGQQSALRFSHNHEILFGLIQIDESDFTYSAVGEAGKTPLQKATEYAYGEIFKLTDALEFPTILRFWNFFADINGHSHGTERYRQFNVGRQDGFLSRGRAVTGSVPAASALGFAQGPLTIYFLASRKAAPVAIENPRQLSAYQYPDDYGPRSPTFSRASVVRLDGRDLLFMSGTASIVGHETLHTGDVLAQTRETIANIRHVVAEANRVVPQAQFTLGELFYKVYVRYAADVAAIHAELRCSLGETAHITFLNADICRQDLLMEIEATGGHPMQSFSA